MKKKTWVLAITLIILAAIAGGFFWWQELNRSKVGRPESLRNYVMKNTKTGMKMIENKKVGLTFVVPSKWKVEETKNITGPRGGTEYGLRITTEDIKLDLNSPWVAIPKKGCLINIYVRNDKERAEEIRKEIVLTQEGKTGIVQREVLQVDNKVALKTIHGNPEKLQNNPNGFFYITIETAPTDRVYTFETYISSAEYNRCTQEFDSFLKNISIK